VGNSSPLLNLDEKDRLIQVKKLASFMRGWNEWMLLAQAYGGRGWNRTTNLSIKSRMLCQLSYASGREKGPNHVEEHDHARLTPPPRGQSKYSILSSLFQSTASSG
jgi:hypothetical protein